MYAVEFQAPIENGIVHIPKQFQDIQNRKKATFVVMYESISDTIQKEVVQSQLEEFRRLRAKSNNQIEATMERATNIDEMVDDGIF
ncbi:MAG: hypothetical protein KU38_02530 [Sulfurovum sp. FS08-3]|nr:MAG: hypothetical protein KU38_02530 [Sulfurovum sp. FS08-3]